MGPRRGHVAPARVFRSDERVHDRARPHGGDGEPGSTPGPRDLGDRPGVLGDQVLVVQVDAAFGNLVEYDLSGHKLGEARGRPRRVGAFLK